MKKRLPIVMTLLCLLLSLTSLAQSDTLCGFDGLLQHDTDAERAKFQHLMDIQDFRERGNLQTLPNGSLFGENQTLSLNSCRKAKYLIPVVVHIIHQATDSTPGMGTNISDDQVQSALRILNARFANDANVGSPAVNTGIQFFLVNNGITRRANTLTSHRSPQDVTSLMALDYQDHNKYLNIWVVKEILDTLGQNTGILGYATMPQSRLQYHGIVMNYQRFGNIDDCSGCNLNASANGVVLAHEVGHFLGLYHTFSGGCTGMDNVSCAVEGDLCCDVPPVSGQNFICSVGRNTCSETPDLYDQVQNYMDYSGESCQTTFTADQAEIMQAVLNSSRRVLASPANLTTLVIQGCHKAATFTSNLEFACIGIDSFALEGAYYSTASHYRWYLFRNDTLVRYASNTTRTFNFNPTTSGTYTVKLTITFDSDNDSVSFTRMGYLEVANCGTPLPNTQASWAFGFYGGLQFTTGGVKMNPFTAGNQPNNIYSGEGSVSVANAAGQMLFYAGGRDFNMADSIGRMAIFNKNYLVMLNSHNIWGSASSTQGVISIPFPGNATRYYLVIANQKDFHTTPYGMRYSVIDTTLDSGLGGVVDTLKNIAIPAPSFITFKGSDSSMVPGEGMTVVPKCNGSDYWLIVQSSPYSNETYKGLLVYSVTASGITYHSAYATDKVDFIVGQLKASPSGRFLAGYGQVFHFDRENGNITGILFGDSTLPLYYDSVGRGYGHCFSPDSRLVYMEEGKNIYQYNVMSNNPVATRKMVGVKPEPRSNFSCLQVGPDNRMYFARAYSKYVGVIENPNVRDTVDGACGFKSNGTRLYGLATGSWGLPNMVDAKKITNLPSSFEVAVKNCRQIQCYSNIHCAASYKWYFGDGDSSTAKDPSHTYLYDANFTIRLVTPDTSITRIVKIGGFHASLEGDTLFCDTPTTIYFSTARNSDYSYQWTVTSGGTFASSSTTEEAAVTWRDEGTIKIKVTDMNSGCQDSSSQSIYRRIPPITGNHIDSSLTACTQLGVTRLFGNRASGGSGAITYEWRKKTLLGEWETVTGATDTFYMPPLEDSTLYVRVAKSGGCENYSNILVVRSTIKNNVITLQNRACIPGQTFNVSGSQPTHSSDTIFNYRWEYSANGTSWSNIPPPDTLHAYYDSLSLTWSINADSVYVRRQVTSSPGNCALVSNIIKVHPLIYLTYQPRDTMACGPNYPYYFKVAVHNETDSVLQYDWQWKDNGSTAAWGTASGGDSAILDYFATSKVNTPGDSFHCVVITPCGNITSRVATLYINHQAEVFVTHPTNQTSSHGGFVTFTCSLGSASRYGLRYYWQVSYDDGQTWAFINGANDSFYTVTPTYYCMNKSKYRVATFNGCYGYQYSNSATMFVTAPWYISDALMMRDATTDYGLEPNPQNNIWASPDIWFSRNPAITYDYNNNNIEYKALQPTGYAKVKITNAGGTPSTVQKAVLHWTVASTLELWPKHWLSTPDNIFVNQNTGSGFYLDTFPRGGIIDTVSIPVIGVGKDTILVVPWQVPNPAWYGVDGIDSSLMVCLLARIITCDEKPYGMTFPEGLVTATNARNNRKIITRNFHVVDTASGDMQGKPGGGNYWAQNMNAAYHLKAVSCDYFDYGVVDIVMDDVLSNAWYANGAHGSGFTVIDDHTIRITDTCDVWLTDVAFGPNEETQVKIHFVTDESYERTAPMSFDFEWYQYNQDSLALDTPLADGGMMLRCDLPDNVAAHYLDNQILITSSGIPYKHSICNGAVPPPLIGSNPVTPSYWTYQWQSTTDTMGVWTDIFGATDRDYTPSINNANMFYRRGALKQHALALNYSPIFFMRLRDPMILTHPSNASVNEGDIASFIVSYQDMEVVNWTRTHSSIGAIIDKTSDTLNFQTQECYNGNTFQAVLRDVCTEVQTSTSSATLTVNPVSDNLYAQDNTSGSFIWSSPDMINRRDNDGGSTHQTPEFGNPNYIYTTVRNNGIVASAPAKLYLYWSAATTGAAWERNWKFDTTESAETGNWIMYQGAKTPLGGLIGIHDIPSIASSSYYRSETEWNPIDPAVYGLENTTLSDIILLGRIVTCEDEPYGMNPTEVNDLAYNVRYNERIISKHKIVTDVIPGNDVIHKAGNGNINDISMDGRLVFKALDCDYFRYGYVLLHTDATLQSIWTNSDGSGYTVLNDSTLQVDSCQNVLMRDIGYGANQRAWLGVEFVTWDTLTVDTTEDYYFEFDLEQYMNGDNDTSVGGIRYGVPIHLEPPAPESLIRKEDPKERITFSAYPNPFRDEMNISYKLPKEANVSITVVNMLGQQVRVLEQGNFKTAGTHRLLLNSSFLKEGIYFINFTAGSYSQTQKVVLIR